MLRSTTWDELAVADRQGPEQQQPLVGFGQAAHEGGQALQVLGVLDGMGGHDGPQVTLAQQASLDEQVGAERVASRRRYGQQTSSR
jgi:hypothetical protein